MDERGKKQQFWDNIATDAYKAFTQFLCILSENVSDDSPVHDVKIGDNRKTVSFGVRFDNPLNTGESTEYLTVEVLVSLSGTSGYARFKQPQHHQLDNAPPIMEKAADIVADLLAQASLSPKARFDYQLENRNSLAECWWDIYPATHPKILARRSRH